jgi:hypothetical protein
MRSGKHRVRGLNVDELAVVHELMKYKLEVNSNGQGLVRRDEALEFELLVLKKEKE